MTSKEFLLKAKELGFKNFQIYKNHTYNQTIECLNDTIVNDEITDIVKYTYKGEIYNKTVSAASEYLEESNLLELKEIASSTDTNYQNLYLENSDNIEVEEDIEELDLENDKVKLLSLNALRRKYPEVTNLTTVVSYVSSYHEITDLNKVTMQRNSSNFEFYVEVMVSNSTKNGTASNVILTTSKAKDEINYEEITEKCIKDALLHLNEEPLSTKKYDIILQSEVVNKLLNKFIAAINGELIKKRKSVMVDKLDTEIFNKIITIKEEPLNKNLPGYVTFDNEGTKTFDKTIVEKGILKTYLYNNKSALDNNQKSTGNNFGPTTCRNMYLEKGTKSYEELIKTMKNGLIIENYMGSSSSAVDILTGNISIQIIGLIVKDGKIISGFIPCILSSNIFEIFKNISEIGNDIKFTSTTCGSPSILIKDINVSSN